MTKLEISGALCVAAMAGLLGLTAMLSPTQALASEPLFGLRRHTINYAGARRHFWLYVPPGGQPGGRPLPLLFALHGWTQTGIGFAARTGFHRQAARHRFIVAFPFGRGGKWHTAMRPADARNDVGFIRMLAKTIDARFAAVDRKRIYAVGFSMGGMMSLWLACQASDLLAGVAAVSATLPVKLAPRCRPTGRISVLLIHGTLDPISPYSGGRLAAPGQPPMRMQSVEASAQVFAHALGCAKAVQGRLPSARLPAARRIVRRSHYSGCKRGRVEAWALPGQGHKWPRVMIDATSETWRYFAQTRR